MQSIMIWTAAIYLLSVFVCWFLYKKWAKIFKDKESIKRLNYFYNVENISWIASWIPVFNIHFAYLMIADIYKAYKEVKKVRNMLKGCGIKKIVEKVLKDNPDDEAANYINNFIDNK